jgi:lysophospholipid acyltransferase (LPLAT)-like uncharacterized protein
MEGEGLGFRGMRAQLSRLLIYLSFFIAWPIVKLYHLTCRIEHRGPLPDCLKRGDPVLLACWHQDMVFNFSFLARYARKRKIIAIVSRSRDGELAAYLLKKNGIYAVRGSSSRGGLAAFNALSAGVRDGNAIGVVVCDGPRPPARVAKFGVVALARDTGLPVYLVRSWAERQYIFRKSWPKLAIVVPFSRVLMLSDGPIHVPPDTPREGLDKYRLEVQDGLNRMADESERHFR